MPSVSFNNTLAILQPHSLAEKQPLSVLPPKNSAALSSSNLLVQQQGQEAIQALKEAPMSIREWVRAAVEMLFLISVVVPVWFVAGVILIFPMKALHALSPHFSEGHKKRIDAVYTFAREIFSLLAAGGKYVSAYFKSHEVTHGNGRPILLVHGYLHNASGWSYYLKRLSKEGFGPIYTINLSHPFLSIQDYALQVKEKAAEIEKSTHRKDLILIGHSMGGIVSSLYATKLAPAGTVTDVITLGSPLRGSLIAEQLAVGPNGREMRPGSLLLQEVEAGIRAKEKQIRFAHAGSRNDELVPIESSLLGFRPENELAISRRGHVHLMVSKKVADWVCARLKAASGP